jgi:hypothetical protein
MTLGRRFLQFTLLLALLGAAALSGLLSSGFAMAARVGTNPPAPS